MYHTLWEGLSPFPQSGLVRKTEKDRKTIKRVRKKHAYSRHVKGSVIFTCKKEGGKLQQKTNQEQVWL